MIPECVTSQARAGSSSWFFLERVEHSGPSRTESPWGTSERTAGASWTHGMSLDAQGINYVELNVDGIGGDKSNLCLKKPVCGPEKD